MTWFKVDDTLHSHPKVRKSGLNAVGIWVMAGSYASAYKTNGFVPDWWVRELGRQGVTAAQRLVKTGLWDIADSDEPGYQFHDWSDYQPLSDDIERDRELARERQKRSRERKSRHAAGDHSLCDRCSARHANVTRDVTRESRPMSRVSHSTPTRPDPTRPDKGQGKGQERDQNDTTQPPPGGGVVEPKTIGFQPTRAPYPGQEVTNSDD